MRFSERDAGGPAAPGDGASKKNTNKSNKNTHALVCFALLSAGVTTCLQKKKNPIRTLAANN